MNTGVPPVGIVLFAHGSRDPLWHKPVEAVATRIRAVSSGAAVACAYLELSSPDLPTAVGTLVSSGVTQVTIVPMFLGVGRHAREDLPLLVQALQTQFPALNICLQRAVGEDPRLIELLADIALTQPAQ